MAKRGRKPRGAMPPPPPDVPLPLPDPKDEPLTDTERRFVDAFLVSEKAVRAYLSVFPESTYRNAAEQSCKWRKKPNIQAEITARRRDIAKQCRLDAANALREASWLAYSDIGDLFDPETNRLLPVTKIPLHARRCIQSVKVRRECVTTRRTTITGARGRPPVQVDTTVHEQELEFKLYDKQVALGKVLRYLGLETVLPPIESVLQALPPRLAAEVRAELTAAGDAGQLPSGEDPQQSTQPGWNRIGRGTTKGIDVTDEALRTEWLWWAGKGHGGPVTRHSIGGTFRWKAKRGVVVDVIPNGVLVEWDAPVPGTVPEQDRKGG
jgi:hypothetical protein